MEKPTLSNKVLSLNHMIALARTPLYRNGYALIFSTAATSVMGLLYWALAARFYSVQTVGSNTATLSTMVFVSGIAQFNLKGALIRFIPQSGKHLVRLVGLSYLVSAIVSFLVAYIVILGMSTWLNNGEGSGRGTAFMVWFAAATAAWSIFALQDNVLTGLRQAVWVPLENTVFSIVKIILLLLFSQVVPEYGIFASWTIPVFISLVPVNVLIFRKFMPKHVRATVPQSVPISVNQIARFVFGDYIGSLFLLASTTLLPILVQHQVNVSATAYFFLAWTIANSLLMLASNMVTSFTVEASVDQSRLSMHAYRSLTHVARLLIPAVIVIAIGAPYLLNLFGKDYSTEGTTVLRLLVLAAVPNMINVLYLGVARVHRQIQRVVVVQGVLCLLTLSLSNLLLPDFGIIGIGLASLISQSAVALILFFTQLQPILLKGRRMYESEGDAE